MMFSSNQILVISGPLDDDTLNNALEFALKISGYIDLFTRENNPTRCVFQITEDGKYCIGWQPYGKTTSPNWKDLIFKFDIDIISSIIKQHLKSQKGVCNETGDGSYSPGFIMKVIDDKYFRSEFKGIKEPFYGIVEFNAYTCFYAK